MKWKTVTTLFYERMQANGNIIQTTKPLEIIFVYTDFDDLRDRIDKIVMEYYSTCVTHELKSISKYKGDVFYGGKLL
jgi:hypothetical protein